MDSTQPDAALKAAFADLQAKMMSTKQALNQNEKMCELSRAEIRRCELMRSVLDELPAGTPTYKAVGTMFRYEELNMAKADVTCCVLENKSSIAAAQKQKEYLEKELTDKQNNIREMIQEHKNRQK